MESLPNKQKTHTPKGTPEPPARRWGSMSKNLDLSQQHQM